MRTKCLNGRVIAPVVAALLAATTTQAADQPAGVRADYADLLKTVTQDDDVGARIRKFGPSQVEEWRKVAAAGDAAGQWMYGLALTHGGGVPQDKPEAFHWFRKAADQNLPVALVWVGESYRLGTVGDKAPPAAEKWYRRAADLGFPMGLHRLANCYEQGWGVGKDGVKSAALYRQAGDAGYLPGVHAVGNTYRFGFGVAKDADKAAEWYKKAIDLGYGPAKDSLAALSGKAEPREVFTLPVRPGSAAPLRGGANYGVATDRMRQADAIRAQAQREAERAAAEAVRQFRQDVQQRTPIRIP